MNSSGYEPLNPENELWRGEGYRENEVFFEFIKNKEWTNKKICCRQMYFSSILSCLKLFCQINLIGTAVNMGETAKNKSHPQLITFIVLTFFDEVFDQTEEQ